jgi:hypothetical protein
VQAPAADRMDETECVLPAKLRSKARRAMSAGGGVSGASGDLAGGSSDDNETPRQPLPAVALFEKVIALRWLLVVVVVVGCPCRKSGHNVQRLPHRTQTRC